jgi:hypothetical protein
VSEFEWLGGYGRLNLSEKFKEFWNDIKQKNSNGIYYLIHLMSKFLTSWDKLLLIYTDLYLKQFFENPIVSPKQSIRSVVEVPEISLKCA